MENPEGATPISAEDEEGLIPTHITTRAELNAWEQQNILKAEAWALVRPKQVLSTPFLKQLHKRMFDETWRWAGTYRLSDKNLGIPWHDIPTALTELIRDVAFWLEHATYSIDEAGARLHHRLTVIHAFPNGNGRHARLMTDVFLVDNGRGRFSWGADLARQGDPRAAYSAALQAADGNDYRPLLGFLAVGARL